MTCSRALLTGTVVAAIIGLAGTVCLAQDASIHTSFAELRKGVPAVLYQPAMPGPKSHVGVLVMHASEDYLTFSACTELSKRGYTVLCANNNVDKANLFEDGDIDEILTEVKLGVTYLRSQPGIQKVVLFGHSGGATIMTAYQAIAENGVAFCQGPEKIHKCPDSLAGLAPADGVVLADANWGNAEMVLMSVDPAVVGQDSGMTLNPALDMFNPANGFNPGGSMYSAAFIHKFLGAEGARDNAIIRQAQARLAAIQAGRGHYIDDEPFFVPGANLMERNNKLFSQDVALLSHTRKPWPLLHADGTSTVEIVHSVRVPGNTENLSKYMGFATLKTTVQNYLANFAVRTTKDYGYDADTVRGVDWTSTYSSPPGNIEGIAVPLLAMGMTGHWEGLAAETIYDHAKSTDKTLAFVEGATHFYTTCKPCETHPGQFGDTLKTTYDYIDGWLSAKSRFLATP